MRRKAIISILCACLLLLPHVALAVDLPINIDAIGQVGDDGHRYAVTTRFGIDLFSESAEEVNAAIANQHRLARERVEAGIFEDVHALEEVDVEVQVLHAVSDSDLFAEPLRFARATAVEAEEPLPVWLIAIVMLSAAGFGLLIAQAVVKRRERT